MKAERRSGLRRKLAAAVAACFAVEVAYANPVGPNVVRGQVSFATQGNTLSVTNTPGAIINWQQFSIQANEATRFIQQSASSAVLNRVVGVDPSRILGTLQSNGRVFLINPNGILFGAGARIDVGGLVASTLKLSNEDFIAGRMHFVGDVGQAAAVINQGSITAAQGGRVYLIGQAVENQGVINAANGDIVLAAGHSVRVTEGASPGVQVEIVAPADRTVNVSELVYSPRGIYAGLVRNSGVIQANSVVRGADGSITLKASQELALEPGSKISANGRIVMEALKAAIAGSVEALGSAAAIALSARETTVQGELHSAGELKLSTEDLTIADGSLRTNRGAMAISGDYRQSGGHVALGASVIAVGGNWRREGGSFDPGTSTVEFTDATKVSTISGENTFYNFTSVTPSKHLVFEAGATQTVLNDFTLRGEKFRLVDLRSRDPGGEQWRLDARGNVDVKFVHLGDAWNVGPRLIKALPSNSYGNNTGWDTDPIWVAVAAGIWSTAANWDTGVVPGVADTVTFNATSVQNSTVDAGFAGTIANLNINAGYTGTINLARSLTVNTAYTQADGNFTAAGQALTVTGAYSLSSGNFTASSGTTTLGNNVTVSGGAFNANGGSISLTGINTPTVNIGATTLNNVTINKTGANSLNVTGTMNVGGNLTITSVQNINTGTVAVAGSVTTTDASVGGTGTVLFNGPGNQTLSAAGGTGELTNVVINKPSGTLTLQDTLQVKNSWTHTAGSVNAGTSTLVFTAGANSVNDSSTTFNNVNLSIGSNTMTVTGTLNVAGNLQVTSVSSINAGTIAVAGNVTTTDTSVGGTGTILMNGSGNQTIGAAGATGELPNVLINKPSGTLTVQDTIGLKDWTRTAGTVNASTSAIVFTAGGNTVNDNATSFNNVNISVGSNTFIVTGAMNVAGNLSITSASNINSGTIVVAGNVTTTDSSVDGSATIVFNGAGNQSLNAAGGTGGLPNVQINKPSGTLSLFDTLNIDGNWTRSAGTVNAGTGTVAFTGTGTVNDSITSFNNVNLSVGSSADLAVTGTMNVGGNLGITLVRNINTGTIAVAGNVTTTDSIVGGTGTILFNGAGNQSLNAAGGIGEVPSVLINKPSGTLSLFDTINVSKDWTWNAGAVNAGSSTLVSAGGGTINDSNTSFNNFTVSSGNLQTLTVIGTMNVDGNLAIANVQNINGGTIAVKGNVTSTDPGVGGTAGLTLNGTGTQTITAAATDLPDGTLTINKSSGTAFLGSNLTLNGVGQVVAISQGVLDLAGFNLTAGALSNNAVLRLRGNESVSLANDTDSGTWEYVGDGAGGLNSFTIKDFGATDYFSLVINGLNGAETFTVASPLKLNGALTHTAGTLNLGANVTTNAGTITSNALVTLSANVALDTTNAGAAAGGAGITFSGVLNAGGNPLTLAAGAGNVSLANAGNDFATVGVTNANNATLNDISAIDLGASTVNGNLAVTAGGTVSQSGAVTVLGSSSFTLTAAGSDVLLDTAVNNFGGAVSFGGTLANIRDVGLRNVNAGATVPALAGLTNLRDLTLQFDAAAVALPALTLAAGGDLAVTAGGAITQTGALIVPGTSTLSTNANAITLTNASNDFQGAVSLSNSGANNVALTDTNALILGASTVGATLTVAAGAGGSGTLSQSGALSASVFTASAAGGIALASFANDIATVSLTNTVAGDVAYLSNRATGVTFTGGNAVGALSATEQGAGGITVGAAGISTAAGDLALNAPGGALTISGAITSVSGNVTLTARGNGVVNNNVTTAGNLQLTSGADIDINPAAAITVSGNDVTLTGATLNLGDPAASASLSLSAAGALSLTATNALNIRGGTAAGAFARVEGTGITINADTVLFAGGSGAGAHGAAVANAGDVMLTGTSSITFSAGAGANADGVLSAPTWNVVVTTPLCVSCNVLSANPITNPPSEAGIHALSVSGLTPAAAPPVVVVPIAPALPAIDESAVVAPQLTALQRAEKADASETSAGQLCDDHSVADAFDRGSVRSIPTACKQPNRLIMPD